MLKKKGSSKVLRKWESFKIIFVENELMEETVGLVNNVLPVETG